MFVALRIKVKKGETNKQALVRTFGDGKLPQSIHLTTPLGDNIVDFPNIPLEDWALNKEVYLVKYE